jgi:hypothetical protein
MQSNAIHHVATAPAAAGPIMFHSTLHQLLQQRRTAPALTCSVAPRGCDVLVCICNAGNSLIQLLPLRRCKVPQHPCV